MRDAGFDHVRIAFPYWTVANVNSDDPYVEKVSWRYLLRGIEWAREFGLRINLCLHTAPGSQNGFTYRYRQLELITYYKRPRGANWLAEWVELSISHQLTIALMAISMAKGPLRSSVS